MRVKGRRKCWSGWWRTCSECRACGSGILSSAADVLGMSVVHGMGGISEMCICLARGAIGGEGGEWMKGLVLGFTNPVANCWTCLSCGGIDEDCVGGLDQGLEGGVVLCLDYLCIWQVQVSVYCDRRISARLRCPQCCILLHLINICYLPCICLWQILQIQTCLCVVVRPGFVSTSPAFMRSGASHPADPHGRLN